MTLDLTFSDLAAMLVPGPEPFPGRVTSQLFQITFEGLATMDLNFADLTNAITKLQDDAAAKQAAVASDLADLKAQVAALPPTPDTAAIQATIDGLTAKVTGVDATVQGIDSPAPAAPVVAPVLADLSAPVAPVVDPSLPVVAAPADPTVPATAPVSSASTGG